MNYFYFFFFLFLSIIILYKPLAKVISNWILSSNRLEKTGIFTALVGILCIYFGTKNPVWNERMWMVVTLILGIVLLLRGLDIIFFLNSIKKQIPSLIKHYYKFAIPISIMMALIAFVVVSNVYIGPQ